MTSQRTHKEIIIIEADREKGLDALVSQTAKDLGLSVEQHWQNIVARLNLANMDFEEYEKKLESRKELA